MPWTNKYIGIPFKPDSRDHAACDCWGLVCLVYQEQLGIILPDFRGVFTEQNLVTLRRVAKEMKAYKEKWRKIDSPREYDVIMLRTGAYTWHVGLVVDNRRMLHVMSGINSVVEEYAGMIWKHRIEEFRHYER
jgi:cell wall-associated NlpC family hydrolase